jgi:hypothetical protein
LINGNHCGSEYHPAGDRQARLRTGRITSSRRKDSVGLRAVYTAGLPIVAGVAQTDPSNHGTAVGLNNTALQVGAGIGLADIAAAITAGLNGDTATAVPPDTALHAVRIGALTVVLIPLAGAAIALFGIPPNAADTE